MNTHAAVPNSGRTAIIHVAWDDATRSAKVRFNQQLITRLSDNQKKAISEPSRPLRDDPYQHSQGIGFAYDSRISWLDHIKHCVSRLPLDNESRYKSGSGIFEWPAGVTGIKIFIGSDEKLSFEFEGTQPINNVGSGNGVSPYADFCDRIMAPLAHILQHPNPNAIDTPYNREASLSRVVHQEQQFPPRDDTFGGNRIIVDAQSAGTLGAPVRRIGHE